MHRSSLVAALVLCTVATFFSNSLSGAPIATIVVDKETHFTLTGMGAMFGHDKTATFVSGLKISASKFWAFNLSVVEGILGGVETVTVLGSVQHRKSPSGHGDGAGPTIDFKMFISADGPLLSEAAPGPKEHGRHRHTDNLTGRLQGAAAGNKFHAYNFNIDVQHCPEQTCDRDVIPVNQTVELTRVPEPATFASLLGAALVLVAVRRRR